MFYKNSQHVLFNLFFTRIIYQLAWKKDTHHPPLSALNLWCFLILHLYISHKLRMWTSGHILRTSWHICFCNLWSLAGVQSKRIPAFHPDRFVHSDNGFAPEHRTAIWSREWKEGDWQWAYFCQLNALDWPKIGHQWQVHHSINAVLCYQFLLFSELPPKNSLQYHEPASQVQYSWKRR
jgi:hypothetical protein